MTRHAAVSVVGDEDAECSVGPQVRPSVSDDWSGRLHGRGMSPAAVLAGSPSYLIPAPGWAAPPELTGGLVGRQLGPGLQTGPLPEGSAKAAVRRPQGRSTGPLSRGTPCSTSSAHTASASSTSMVSSSRAPASGAATGRGPTSGGASCRAAPSVAADRGVRRTSGTRGMFRSRASPASPLAGPAYQAARSTTSSACTGSGRVGTLGVAPPGDRSLASAHRREPAFVLPSQEGQPLVRMAELCRRSGVPVATIKFYIRLGLLPAGGSPAPRGPVTTAPTSTGCA